VPSDSDEFHEALAEAGGALRFDRFVDLALYGRTGFYTASGRAGRRGDFLTSPEVGPLFGAVVARWLDFQWECLDRPEPFRVIELGAGPGTLARTVIAARPACCEALDYVAVEVSAAQRASHPDGVRSLAGLPDGAAPGFVIANELLDNLPFRLLVFDGAWREAYVTAQGSRFVEILEPLDGPPPVPLPAQPPHGARVPLHDAAVSLLAQVRRRLEPGRILLIDYAVATTATLASRPWREWLRTYRHHERGRHYLIEPGTQDITTEVALDQIIAALGPCDELRSQAQWLRRWGIDALVEEGRRVWQAQAARPGLEAMRMRSRIGEADALLDPDGLGAFVVAEWQIGAS